MKYTLIRNSPVPYEAINSNDANKHKQQNNVNSTSMKSRTHEWNNHLCHLPRTVPSLFSIHNSKLSIQNTPSNAKLVAITARANFLKDTFQIPIKKLFIAPNKKFTINMDKSNTKNFNSVANQTDSTSNKGKGLDLLDLLKHERLFSVDDESLTPFYRENLSHVFNKERFGQLSKKELTPIIEFIKNGKWEKLKVIDSLYYRIRRDLSVSPTGWLFYDNKLIINIQDRQRCGP